MVKGLTRVIALRDGNNEFMFKLIKFHDIIKSANMRLHTADVWSIDQC